MPIGESMSQTVPAVGTAGTGYASTLVSLLTEMKARLVAKVPLSSLLIGLLDMANNAITNLAYATLYPQTVTPPTNSIYNYGGNAWWVGASGAVQITDGTTLSVASAGAITGDYGGSDPSRFKFVAADKEYYAYDDEAGGAWARIWARGYDIAGGDTSASRLRLEWVAGTSYTLTFPAAVPATTKLLQMDNTGAVTASNATTGDLSATGVVSGSDVKHTSPRSRFLHASAGQAGKADTQTGWQLFTTGVCWTNQYNNDAACSLMFPVDIDEGDQIVEWNVRVGKFSAGTHTITAGLYKQSAWGALTLVGSTVSSSANNPGSITLGSGAITELAGTDKYVLKIISNNLNSDFVYSADFAYTRPV